MEIPQDKRLLAAAAFRLADEIRDGRWRHVYNPAGKPVTHCSKLIEELQRRCPGFSVPEYENALAQGMVESR